MHILASIGIYVVMVGSFLFGWHRWCKRMEKLEQEERDNA
jgi:hypothetical protein